MEKLLERYLKNFYGYETIYLRDFSIDGAICAITFSHDVDGYYKESHNINIWDMLKFLNT